MLSSRPKTKKQIPAYGMKHRSSNHSPKLIAGGELRFPLLNHFRAVPGSEDVTTKDHMPAEAEDRQHGKIAARGANSSLRDSGVAVCPAVTAAAGGRPITGRVLHAVYTADRWTCLVTERSRRRQQQVLPDSHTPPHPHLTPTTLHELRPLTHTESH